MKLLHQSCRLVTHQLPEVYCCLQAGRFQVHYLYRQLSMVTFMLYDGRQAFSFQRLGTLTVRLVRHTRRCIGSSIVYLRVPDEEDIRVLSDIIYFVSRSRMYRFVSCHIEFGVHSSDGWQFHRSRCFAADMIAAVPIASQTLGSGYVPCGAACASLLCTLL